MPCWRRRSRRRRVFRLDAVAAPKRTTHRAGSVASATTSSTPKARRSVRAGQPVSSARAHPSVAAASVRTARADQPPAGLPASAARSTRTAARGSAVALKSPLVSRVAPAATPPARSPKQIVPSMLTAAPIYVPPVSVMTRQVSAYPLDQPAGRLVQAHASNENSVTRTSDPRCSAQLHGHRSGVAPSIAVREAAGALTPAARRQRYRLRARSPRLARRRR